MGEAAVSYANLQGKTPRCAKAPVAAGSACTLIACRFATVSPSRKSGFLILTNANGGVNLVRLPAPPANSGGFVT